MKFPLDNSYSLLMIFLSPLKSKETIAGLIEQAKNNNIHWEGLLYQANIQMCTPLWYSQLKKDKILPYLPEELALYLAEIYQSNSIRNEQLQQALLLLLIEFNKASIDTLLLKGAATFCDQLFSDNGSRFMGDLDILVPIEQLESCQHILQCLGYQKLANENIEEDSLPTNTRHHQLPRYILPNTPVAVEIHFKISYGLAGRIITAESAWNTCHQTNFRGQKTAVLSVDNKLLLNSVHALLPYREFIRGHISLLHLSEFVLLAHTYAELINWQHWFDKAQHSSLTHAFDCYLGLAVQYMNLSITHSSDQNKVNHCQQRIVFIGHYDARLDHNASFHTQLKRFLYRLSYYKSLPLWMWQNLCYAQGWKHLPARLFFCLKKVFSAYSWSKI